MWEDPDEAGDVESLSSDEFSLPMEEAFLPPVPLHPPLRELTLYCLGKQ